MMQNWATRYPLHYSFPRVFSSVCRKVIQLQHRSIFEVRVRANMSTSKPDHAERTSHEPRDSSLHKVLVTRVDDVNPTIRTFRLTIPPASGPGIRFLPGQWLDVFVPGIDKPGGFTITSPPSKASGLHLEASKTASSVPPNFVASSDSVAEPDSKSIEDENGPYVELAIQKSPENVVARWLWQDTDKILSSELHVRVGGSFVWPPPSVMHTTLKKLIFIAGGVGINPLISMLSHLAENPNPRQSISFLYTLRDPGEGERKPERMLFLNRLAEILVKHRKMKGELNLYLSPGPGGKQGGDGTIEGLDLPFKRRRITVDDVDQVLGDDKRFSVVYICGVPGMTDEFVDKLTSPQGLGLDKHRVLFEKWW